MTGSGWKKLPDCSHSVLGARIELAFSGGSGWAWKWAEDVTRRWHFSVARFAGRVNLETGDRYIIKVLAESRMGSLEKAVL